jgi:hypothetical protein
MVDEEVMSSGRLFQTVAPATGKAQSPIVDRWVLGAANRCDTAERKLARPTDANVKSVSRPAIGRADCNIP